jgi:hypothetical protein
MDTPNQVDNPEPEKIEGGDFATRRIEPSELNSLVEPETKAEMEAPTVMVNRSEDPASTKVTSNAPEQISPTPKVVEPPKPIAPLGQPAASPTPEMPPKDNRTPIIAIIAVAFVTLVCICACTAIVITALMKVPSF